MQSGSRRGAPLTAVWDTEKTCESRRCGKTGRAEDCADFVPKAKFAGKRRAEAAAVRWAVRGVRVGPSAAMCARRLRKSAVDCARAGHGKSGRGAGWDGPFPAGAPGGGGM